MIKFSQVKSLVKNSIYCSVSIVKKDGRPHSFPIGSVYLESENTGHYIEMFTKSAGLESAEYACIMAVNTSMWFWLKSLLRGRFETPPAIRLLVKLGEKREISNEEFSRFQKRVKPFRRTKGYKKMWSKASYVRPFTVEEIIPVNIGGMTALLKS